MKSHGKPPFSYGFPMVFLLLWPSKNGDHGTATATDFCQGAVGRLRHLGCFGFRLAGQLDCWPWQVGKAGHGLRLLVFNGGKTIGKWWFNGI